MSRELKVGAFVLVSVTIFMATFMYVASEVLKPLALAILLSFALVPISRQLERLKFPRVLAVVLTVLIVLGGLGAVGYKVGQQLDSLADKLPQPIFQFAEYRLAPASE